jgi:hypothetical protein
MRNRAPHVAGELARSRAPGRELMRLPYSRSSIERVGHAVSAEYLSRREQVERKLIETCELPPGIASVSVSVGRLTVPMEEPVPKQPEARRLPVRLRGSNAQVDRFDGLRNAHRRAQPSVATWRWRACRRQGSAAADAVPECPDVYGMECKLVDDRPRLDCEEPDAG